MTGMKFHRPRTLEQALELLGRYGSDAVVLAGGTDLLPRTRGRFQGHVVDITALARLKTIGETSDRISIGALVTHAMLAQQKWANGCGALVGKAASAVGSPQIRNRGTIGGNVVNAAVCADTVAPLTALDARVRLERTGGSRWLPLARFITGPGRTALEPGELLTEIAWQPLRNTKWGFQRLARREAMAIARMNVAVVLTMNDQCEITDARIAPGAVLPRPGRIREAEEILLGQKPAAALAAKAGRAVAAKMVAVSGRRWSTPYKEPVIAVLVERAINQAWRVMEP